MTDKNKYNGSFFVDKEIKKILVTPGSTFENLRKKASAIKDEILKEEHLFDSAFKQAIKEEQDKSIDKAFENMLEEELFDQAFKSTFSK